MKTTEMIYATTGKLVAFGSPESAEVVSWVRPDGTLMMQAKDRHVAAALRRAMKR